MNLSDLIPVSLIRFLLVGIANTAVGLSVIWIFRNLAGVGDVGSNAAGYIIGVLVSFTLNKRWSFSFRGDGLRAFGRFLLVFLVAYGANLTAVAAAIALAGHSSYWCQLAGVVPYTTLFYLGCRSFAFPQPAARTPPVSPART